MYNRIIFIALFIFTILIQSCSKKKKVFDQLNASSTGIEFENTITENDSMNVLLFEYIYNGGGVGVGDVNNDGLQDIFFAGNMVSSRLYLNQGNFKFKDVTEQAHVGTTKWCTGVAMIDINQDGLLDIHVSTINPKKGGSSSNLVFLNKGFDQDGQPVFVEVAHQIGLDDPGYSTQSVFLDYDHDGDLDMYLANNALENFNRNTPFGQREDGGGKSIDKFYRNDGNDSSGMPIFIDASREAGVLAEGWGLGVIANDFNNDGYTDVYVANDFLSSDHLFINNQNKTFTNSIGNYMKHEEYNGMGIDVADINNDGLNDLTVMDMMPDDNLRQKTMFSTIGYDKFFLNLNRKYQPQYVRNVLQLNNGNGTFSDIGYLAGVNATDWSWSALFADFDNDGYRDLLITNGYRKDVTDLDFAAYSKQSSMFGTKATRLEGATKAISELEGVKKPNFIFKNNGDLTFTNQAEQWGLGQPSYSNGAAYADFDNDGDLDIVMNNINDKAFLYRNNIEQEHTSGHNYLRLKLIGEKGNKEALGTKISIYRNGDILYAEHQLQRGYKSTVDPIEHFGLGQTAVIDSILIIWPTGKQQVLKTIKANQQLVLKEQDAIIHQSLQALKNETLFEEAHLKYSIVYKQTENDFVDYKQGQSLLPHKHSQLGPGIAAGDMNGDGREDFIIGASTGEPATIFYQQANGIFKTDSLPAKANEDMGVLLFDADDDHDLDLYCVSGSSEFGMESGKYQDRFYRNMGNGNFLLDTLALPNIESSGSCVTACDYDQDGDLDLFVGGRILPTRYPLPPNSYLLQNNGKGKFEDVTNQCNGLQNAGMVTAALWSDFDNDGWIDLILVGEWMPITFYKNKGGKLERYEIENLVSASTIGWWNSIIGADFDNDGDIDYVAGNLGLNSRYHASEKEPVCVYAKDFDNNGSMDPVLCLYIQGKEYITHSRETLTEQMVGMRRVLQRYSTYGKSTFQDIFPKEKLEGALIYKSTLLTSTYFENMGNGKFNMRALPVQAQTSPMFGMMVADVNGDGYQDLVSVGNSYSTETLTGFYDAGIGTCLLGNGKGDFRSMPVTQSGFFVDKDAKGFASVALANGKQLRVVTSNQDSVKVFEEKTSQKKYINLEPDDIYALITFKDGTKRKVEFYYGEGYLSQSSRVLTIPLNATNITIHKNKNKTRTSLINLP